MLEFEGRHSHRRRSPGGHVLARAHNCPCPSSEIHREPSFVSGSGWVSRAKHALKRLEKAGSDQDPRLVWVVVDQSGKWVSEGVHWMVPALEADVDRVLGFAGGLRRGTDQIATGEFDEHCRNRTNFSVSHAEYSAGRDSDPTREKHPCIFRFSMCSTGSADPTPLELVPGSANAGSLGRRFWSRSVQPRCGGVVQRQDFADARRVDEERLASR
jgi:hypothetical protein